jgi:hypothetical protein
VTAAERRFFEAALRRFDGAEADAAVAEACAALEPCAAGRREEALRAAKRVALLTVAWPSRKAEIVGAIPRGLLETFPQTTEWAKIVGALQAAPV